MSLWVFFFFLDFVAVVILLGSYTYHTFNPYPTLMPSILPPPTLGKRGRRLEGKGTDLFTLLPAD